MRLPYLGCSFEGERYFYQLCFYISYTLLMNLFFAVFSKDRRNSNELIGKKWAPDPFGFVYSAVAAPALFILRNSA